MLINEGMKFPVVWKDALGWWVVVWVGWCGGGQVGRFACGFAPACGSKVGPLARAMRPKAEALGYLLCPFNAWW